MTNRVKPKLKATSHTSELILMVGLIGALVWNIHGKSCSSKAECQPDISCHTVPWFCNSTGSDDSATTATPNPASTTRCCVHLGTCGGDTEIAGWINVRNSSIQLDGVPYSAEWLDTFVTEGNATQPAVIKSTYVGSWSTLQKADMKFPSQMFVAEPTNSCTVDGDPKWPEWYQVTVNVVENDMSDSTLEVEDKRSKDCMCDVDWHCIDSTCWVETQNISEAGANLAIITDPNVESNVAKFCRNDNITVVNYTSSSLFALGFGPEQSQIDSFNFNTSVEGGWSPDLEDTNMWIQVDLAEDTIITGIMTQGVAVNPERRVDEYMVEYEASDSAAQVYGTNKTFKAGARLDTKMINSFLTPIKANRVKLLISKPCDPYYVGLRFAVLGCPVCDADPDCTEAALGTCEPEKFCTYQVWPVITTTPSPTHGITTPTITTPVFCFDMDKIPELNVTRYASDDLTRIIPADQPWTSSSLSGPTFLLLFSKPSWVNQLKFITTTGSAVTVLVGMIYGPDSSKANEYMFGASSKTVNSGERLDIPDHRYGYSIYGMEIIFVTSESQTVHLYSCPEKEPTTLMPTSKGPTTGPITTPEAVPVETTEVAPTGRVTSEKPTPVAPQSPEPTTPGGTTTVAPTTIATTAAEGLTTGADQTAVAETTAEPGATSGASQTPAAATTPAPTTESDSVTTEGPATTAPPTQATAEQTPTPTSAIENKVNEVTQNLPPKVKVVVKDLIVNLDLDGGSGTEVFDPTMYPQENVTKSAIKAGLEVIRNITVQANASQDTALQVQIIKSAWNFLAAVSVSPEFVTNSTVDTNLLEEYMDVSSLVLDPDRKEAWKEVQEESVAGPLGIVTSVEDVATRVAAAVPNINHTIKTDNIEGLIQGRSKKDLVREDFVHNFPDESGNPEDSTEVTISEEDFQSEQRLRNVPEDKAVVVVVLKFSSMTAVLNKKDVQDKTPIVGGIKRVGSDILSISVVTNESISMPLSFRLGHEQAKPMEEQRCNYWKPHNKFSGEWTAEGCDSSNLRNKSTRCTCSHMTNYAVLMWLGEEPPREDDASNIISKVGLLVSIAALALAVGLLLFLRSSLSSERIIIHMHLMSVTLVALILFLAAVDKTENKLVCTFITIALHFFYMSMFSWMLVEGIHLYRQIIAVFESEKSRLWVYFAIGWGIPIIVVGITSGIFFNKYKDHKLCWLEVQDGSIWAFLGPMIPILLANLVVLFMVSRIVMSAAKLQQEKPAINSAKAGLRSSLLLLPILGITWVFGYFAHYHIALQYMFVTLNAFQGFFMALFHCFMSSEVNSALKQKIRKVKESSLGGASTVDSLHPKCLMNAEKAPLYEVMAPLETGIDMSYDPYE